MDQLSADRFATWPPAAARLALAVLGAMLLLTALIPVTHTQSAVSATPVAVDTSQPKVRDNDLALYDRVIARMAKGEGYYDVIAEEHRRSQFPLRPAVAVRLPTLAWISARLGNSGLTLAAFALAAAVLIAWWRRLGDEPGGRDRRAMALALLAFGISLATARYFFTLHELWTGMLLALAFALHRPGRWVASLAVAALALAIREHCLPFVLLMAAMAGWRRDWREAGAWTMLALAFGVALALHMNAVARMTLPSDGLSAPWLVLRGITGWTSDIVLSSNLRFLPGWIAGPIVAMALFGWTGWRSPAGAFGALFQAGYAVLFMLAGRPDNYYWGFVVTPTLFMGLAFVPMALRSLLRSGRGPSISAA